VADGIQPSLVLACASWRNELADRDSLLLEWPPETCILLYELRRSKLEAPPELKSHGGKGAIFFLKVNPGSNNGFIGCIHSEYGENTLRDVYDAAFV